MMEAGSFYELRRDSYMISTDPARLDLEVIYGFLSRSYWAAGRPRDKVELSLQHSLNFGLYEGDRQIGLARVITDYAIFAYLCDFFVVEDHQGRGLGTWLIKSVVAHPDLLGLRRFVLTTLDAHEFYRKAADFQSLVYPGRWLEIFRPSEQEGSQQPGQ
jgi:GNAT superfamily N-acetyltransferase